MLTLDVDDEDRPNRTNVCQCGNAKSSAAQACRECARLDGSKPRQALIIDTLRGTDGLSIREICEELDGYVDHSGNYATAMRSLQSLIRDGRVRRFKRESNGVSINVFGMHGVYAEQALTEWAYILDGRMHVSSPCEQRPGRVRVSAEPMLEIVTRTYGITRDELVSSGGRRNLRLERARRVAMIIGRSRGMTYQEIADALGRKRGALTMAIRRARRDAEIMAEAEALQRSLQ